MRAVLSPQYDRAKSPHLYRQEIIEHLESKAQRTDRQKLEIQERRNTLARRVKLWKTAQAVYMPQVPECLAGQDLLTSFDVVDADEIDESKPELWPLLLPSQLSQDNRSSCHKGIVETERTLRLAQVQDNLVDLRRLRRTLRSLRTYFKSNVIGEGQKTQTKSRTVESGVTLRVNRAVRRYRLAYSALLSLDPMGDWRKEYLELTDKDNRGPGKELHEQGVGDGRYTMSWIWGGSLGSEVQDGADLSDREVNETVRHEWMTCRARADRWREEADLLQEEMRRIVVFLEWKSSSWGERVGSRSGSITADIQHGVDSYARKQASIYHELAVSLANQWLPPLLELGLDIAWASTYPWTAKIVPSVGPPGRSSVDKNPSTSSASSVKVAAPSGQRGNSIRPVDSDSASGESDDDSHLEGDSRGEEGVSDGCGIGFEYDDEYTS